MVSRRGFLVGAAAVGGLTTVGVGVGAAPASAATGAAAIPRVGYSAGSSILWESASQMANTLDSIVAVGGKTVRVDIPWYWIQKVKAQFNWGFVDAVINAAVARNLKVLGVLTGCPPWAAYHGVDTPTQRPASAATFATWAATVAARYKNKVFAYEIWNEPNARMYFSPDPDPDFYAEMAIAAYPAIKAVDASATVVVGAMGPAPTQDGMIHAYEFIEAVYDNGLAGYADAISFHPYENAASFAPSVKYDNAPMRQMINMHALMAAHGDGAKKIWLTEYGGPSDELGAQGQADLVINSLLQWPEVSYAGEVFLYTIHDTTGDTFGSFTEAGAPKTLAYAIQGLLTNGIPQRQEAAAFATSIDTSLGGAVGPIYPQAYAYAQDFENGARYLTNHGFLSSPLEVANVARANNILPMAPFADDMQDMDIAGGGRIFSKPGGVGTHLVVGAILSAWTPALGFPTGAEYSGPGGSSRVVEFEHGSVAWSASVGTTVTTT